MLNRRMLKVLWQYSLPLMFGGLLATLMTFMDGVFMARYALPALNAIVLALPFINLASSIASGLAVAASECLGKEPVQQNHLRILQVSATLSFFFSLILVAAAFFALPQIARLAGVSPNGKLPEEYAYFITYWRWVAPSFPCMVFLTTAVQVMVFYQRTRSSNRILLLVTVLNILLNPLFIYVFGWGIRGTALATDIAWLAGVVAVGWRFRKSLWPLFTQKLHGWRPMAAKQLKIAAIVFLSVSTYVVGAMLMNNLCVWQGALAVSVAGIAEQLKSVVIMPSRGVISAYMIVFNQYLAKRDTRNYYPVFWGATALTGALYLPIMAGMAFLPQLIIHVYSSQPSPALTENLVYMFAASAMVLFISIFVRAAQVGFLNLGHSYAVLLHSILQVSFTYLLARKLAESDGIKGIANGQVIGTLAASLLVFVYFCLLLNRRVRKDRVVPGIPA